MKKPPSKDRHLKISMMIELPPPSKQETSSSAKRQPSAEERVNSAIELCQSGHESREEWELLRKVNNHLSKKKSLSNREKRVLAKIAAFLQKHQSASGGKIESPLEQVSLTDFIKES